MTPCLCRWLFGTVTGLLVSALTVLAAGDSERSTPGLGSSPLKALGALLLVLALIVGIAWLARRYLPFLPQNLAKGDQIRILSVRALGPKRSVHLLNVEGHRLLVGSTDSSLTLLKDFDRPEAGTSS